MSDDTPRTTGRPAPANAPAPAAQRRGVGPSATAHLVSKGFDRENYAAETSRGYGESLSRGLELALTLLVMVGIGWLVDHIFGTAPAFIIVFSVLGFAGITVKLFLGYDLEMKKHEEGAIWNRKSGAAS